MKLIRKHIYTFFISFLVSEIFTFFPPPYRQARFSNNYVHFVNFLTKFVILHISLQFCVQNVKRLFLLLNFYENTVLGYKKWSKINFENIFHILLIRKIIFIRFFFKKIKNNDFRAFFSLTVCVFFWTFFGLFLITNFIAG